MNDKLLKSRLYLVVRMSTIGLCLVVDRRFKKRNIKPSKSWLLTNNFKLVSAENNPFLIRL